MDVGLSLILDDDSDPRSVDLLAALEAWRKAWQATDEVPPWGDEYERLAGEAHFAQVHLAAAYDAFMAGEVV